MLMFVLVLVGIGVLLRNAVLVVAGLLVALHLALRPCPDILLAEDDRVPQRATSPTLNGTPARAFVHVPLYQETVPYEELDLHTQTAARNAVDPAVESSAQRIEYVQYLNAGKGSCRKDHWMVQVEDGGAGGGVTSS
jgi:hypothetical protein